MMEYFIYQEFGLKIPGEVILDTATENFCFELLN